MTLNICRKYYNIGKNQLFPICRSITGNGVRETFNIIKKKFSSFKTTEIKSGEKIFDWVVPPEWNISDAYIIDKNGEIADTFSSITNPSSKKFIEVLDRLIKS